MSETLSWNFVGNDRLTGLLEKLSVTLSSVDRKLSEFGRTSTKVKAETEGLQDKVKGLGDTAERTGDKVKRAFHGIDAEIAATALEIKALQEEFARTGNVDLFKKIGDKRSYQSKLSGVFKDLGGDAEKVIANALEGGAKTGLLTGFKDAAASLGEIAPSFGQVGIGVGAALAVPALAGAGGAVTGLAGIGAVGAGVAGAVAGDPQRFRDEWLTQIDSVKAGWINASKAFVGPTLDAIRTIGPMVASWHLDTMFAAAAGYVKPLVAGIEGFATNVMGGVSDLVEHAGPVIAELEATLPEFGSMIADGLSSIADNAEGGAQALGDLIQFAGGLAGLLLEAVAASEKMYHQFKDTDAEASNFIRNNRLEVGLLTFGMSEFALRASDAFNADEVQHFGHVLPGVRDTIDDTGAVAEETARKLLELSDAFDDALGKSISAEQATLSFNKALLDLGDTIKKNGHATSENTAAGIANRETVLKAIGDAERARQANIANGMTVADATAKYDAQIGTLKAHLRQLGFTTAQIEDLTAAASAVPSQIDINVTLRGASAAGAALGNLINMAGGVGKLGASLTAHRALGGAVMPGGVYQVNEHGVETFQPNVPGRIVPAGQGGGNGDVLGVLVVKHVGQNGEEIRTELLQLKRQRGLTSLGLN